MTPEQQLIHLEIEIQDKEIKRLSAELDENIRRMTILGICSIVFFTIAMCIVLFK